MRFQLAEHIRRHIAAGNERDVVADLRALKEAIEDLKNRVQELEDAHRRNGWESK